MVRKIKRHFAFALFSSLIFAQNSYAADLSAYELRDTIYNKPEIVEYFSGDSIDGVSAEAYLDDEELTVTAIKPAAEMNIKTNYLFLVDESGSISNSQILRIREAITAAADNLAENETMTVIAFGESIDIKVDHSTDKDAIKQAAQTIMNDKGGTVFFDVIKRAGDICLASAGERNVVIAISDGADFTVGGRNYDEVEKYVKEYGVTIYAVALGRTGNGYIDRFGQLARASGGKLMPCELNTIDDNTVAVMNDIRNDYAVEMHSSNNNISTTAEKLLLKFKQEGGENALEEVIIPHNWIKDNTAPVMTGLKQLSETSLLLQFSEDVLGADNKANYSIILDDKYEMPVSSVTYDKDNKNASLVFDDGIYKGRYKISCFNITDNSMEKNPLTGEVSAECIGKTVTPDVIVRESPAAMVLLIFAICIIIAGIIAFFAISKRRGLIVHNKKLMFKDNLVEKERIIVPETTNINLIVTTPDGVSKNLNMKIYKSIIVGRLPQCDLSFNDSLLSRQHFVIEENGGMFFVSNLSSTNGTLVNGVPLTNRRKLEVNDVIQAGNEKFTFKG